ncbi:hypothetical protein ZIOFF_041999 [Zingiber officinale]|uniref:Integrase catalytic domain-containing protein n=1 Tax=Zingiber officinale TaxID=94328 RepID=A0A8J5G7G5_ZINOF|nr:hypothetical protein ZIOFF_041999 [Zingiber officinale]
MWVFILAAKNGAFRAFKKFKFLMKNKTEYKIKTLRTNRDNEFLSTEFTQFCENEGIERHLMAPYTPQQNSIVECRNRTMMAMARSLLKGIHMSARFWGEAVRHAIYLLNRLPTKVLGERTPFEAWMGRKPHLAHLRVFSCVAYVKNTTLHLKKLDDRSSPMVYLGIEEGCKAHRLFDPRHDKLQVSRDVMFQENCEWTWNAGANNEEMVPEFMVVDAFGTNEVIIVADIEAATEDVTTPAVAVVPMTGASSPSTPSSNTHTASSPSITNSPESYEGPVRFRSIADIYANTEEVVGINEKEGEVMMMIYEEPTCYQEVATEACWSLEELDFKKCTQEHVVYTRGEGEASLLVGVYVDDLIVTRSSTEKINKFKEQMMTYFELSDLGLLSYYLGIEMTDCNATKHPMEPKTQLHKDFKGTPVDATEYKCIIGCLRYLLHTQPDLSYSVGMKQKTMTLSSCEAEFMAAATAACHALRLRSLASELTGVEPKPVTLFVDNKSAIALMKNPVFHDRSKHIDTMFHFIRECIEGRQIVVEFVNTGEQRANALTKTLPGVKLAAMRQLLDVRDLQPCQD